MNENKQFLFENKFVVYNKFLLDMFKYFKYIQKWNCFISNIIKVLCHVFTYKDSVFQSENEREL